MSLARAADQALTAFLQAMEGTASHQRAELALTLHMLEFLAPRFFADCRLQPRLDAALAELIKVPATFSAKVDDDEAMARLDALYLRKIRGLKPSRFVASELKAAIKRSEQRTATLFGWLMGELALPLGVKARIPLESRWPFRSQQVIHLYHLTHIVLVDTEYLRKPVPIELADELVELQGALGSLAASGSWDLLGECVFCLNRAGTRAPDAIEALLRAQRGDGSFAEADSSPRSAAHCTAVGVLALAGALDLEASAP